MHRGCTIAAGPIGSIGTLAAYFEIIVDLAVRDEHRALRLLEGLISACQIDDGEARIRQSHGAIREIAGPIWAAMNEGGGEFLQKGLHGCAVVAYHYPCNSAHIRPYGLQNPCPRSPNG